MEIKKVLVVGAGLMGRGIAQVFAQSGYTTVMTDIDQKQIDAAMALINKILDKDVRKGKKTEQQKAETLANLTTSNDLEFAREADFIVEAATENFDIKMKIFKS